MTTLTGIKDGMYLAQFLGKKIAIQDERNPNKYYLYPELVSIHSAKYVTVRDMNNQIESFSWSRCENPYIILQDKEIEIR